ncbi:archaeosortase A [Archaeoglobus sp.]
MLIVLSSLLMLIFILSRRRIVGFIAWLLTGFVFLQNVPYFLTINDYFNATVFTLAFLLFTLIGYTTLKGNLDVMIETTRFSLLAIVFYFPFKMCVPLKVALIKTVADQTIALGKLLGFKFERLSWNEITLNGRGVKIILPCTGIESMALFIGACFGVKADLSRKLKAFLLSVPVIYTLNLFRNVFVLASYGYGWFGENSFYIAHNVIAKFLALFSLIVITILVFRELPELENLIVNLKEEIGRVVLCSLRRGSRS